MIEINNLTKKYGKKEVVKGISLNLETCTYGLVGANGAGKTTLIRLLAGVLKPSKGIVDFDWKHNRIGYLPQKFGCFPELTVFEQMKYFACLKEINPKQQKEEILRTLDIVHLYSQKETKCKKLSGGMVRRIGIAQALLGNPNLLLLDEPTVGLDPEERSHFNSIIRTLEGEMTILLSTHLIEDIKYLCRKIIVINSGTILKMGDIEDIIELANGRVYQIPERELNTLKQPYYVESVIEQNGESMVRVLMLGDNVQMEQYCCLEVGIEDGYLFLLKSGKGN